MHESVEATHTRNKHIQEKGVIKSVDCKVLLGAINSSERKKQAVCNGSDKILSSCFSSLLQLQHVSIQIILKAATHSNSAGTRFRRAPHHSCLISCDQGENTYIPSGSGEWQEWCEQLSAGFWQALHTARGSPRLQRQPGGPGAPSETSWSPMPQPWYPHLLPPLHQLMYSTIALDVLMGWKVQKGRVDKRGLPNPKL
jgi:hypothetical protein